jgi:hypothetical protein
MEIDATKTGHRRAPLTPEEREGLLSNRFNVVIGIA